MKPEVRIPSVADLRLLASTLGPMTGVYFCKNLCYIQLQVRNQHVKP